MSCPSKNTLPLSGCSKPPMIRSVVVLPQPDGPRRVTNSFSDTVKYSSSRTSLSPKLLLMSSSLISSLNSFFPLFCQFVLLKYSSDTFDTFCRFQLIKLFRESEAIEYREYGLHLGACGEFDLPKICLLSKHRIDRKLLYKIDFVVVSNLNC